MEYLVFLHEVIDRGIVVATRDYTERPQPERLEAAIAGFNACRYKQPGELQEVYYEAEEYARPLNFLAGPDVDLFHWFTEYKSEIDWVCNNVSVILNQQNFPSLFSWQPTSNAMINASRIIGEDKIKNMT